MTTININTAPLIHIFVHKNKIKISFLICEGVAAFTWKTSLFETVHYFIQIFRTNITIFAITRHKLGYWWQKLKKSIMSDGSVRKRNCHQGSVLPVNTLWTKTVRFICWIYQRIITVWLLSVKFRSVNEFIFFSTYIFYCYSSLLKIKKYIDFLFALVYPLIVKYLCYKIYQSILGITKPAQTKLCQAHSIAILARI